MIGVTVSSLRWFRPVAGQLATAVAQVLPIAAPLGVIGCAVAFVARLTPARRPGIRADRCAVPKRETCPSGITPNP